MLSRPFSTTVQVLPTHDTAPSLSAIISSESAPSNELVFSSSLLELRVRASVKGGEAPAEQEEGIKELETELDAEELSESALLREVRGWFDEQKGSLNNNSVGSFALSPDGSSVILPLHSYARSSICTILSSSSPPANGANSASLFASTPAPSLSSLDLLLTFTLPTITESSSQASLDQEGQQTTTSELSTLLLSPTALHFTLSPLIPRLLTKVAQKLVIAFPLCFNARWIERLKVDRASYATLASSLGNVLNDIKRGGALDTEATLLRLRLSTHLSLTNCPLTTTTIATSSSSSPSRSLADNLSTALLLLARGVGKKDAWKPVERGSEGSLNARATKEAGGVLAAGGVGGKRAMSAALATEGEGGELVDLEDEGEDGGSSYMEGEGGDEGGGEEGDEEMTDLFGDEDGEGEEDEDIEFAELYGEREVGADTADRDEEEDEWLLGSDGEGVASEQRA